MMLRFGLIGQYMVVCARAPRTAARRKHIVIYRGDFASCCRTPIDDVRIPAWRHGDPTEEPQSRTRMVSPLPALALRLRAFGVIKAFQQHELAQGLPLPDGEIEL